MAAAARPFTLSRLTVDLNSRRRLHLHQPLSLPFSTSFRRLPSTLRCLISGVDGGGVSDEFVSTRKSGLDRGFSVIANMLMRIEPLDTSVVSKGVSDSAKDSMKQTISTMLGLLPSDQFSVDVSVRRAPLDRLLASSVITGYTLWNAEYRVSLVRNFHNSEEDCAVSDGMENDGSSEVVGNDEKESEDMEIPKGIEDLSPEALSYINKLHSELSNVKEELKAQKQGNEQLEYDTGHRNDLLDYLRSLDSNMVTELSRPSSLEVKEIIHQLVQNILHRFSNDGESSECEEDLVKASVENVLDSDGELCDTVRTSRDYLAKLLFWCMLLGHHLRGSENRLHLSCVVGLL